MVAAKPLLTIGLLPSTLPLTAYIKSARKLNDPFRALALATPPPPVNRIAPTVSWQSYDSITPQHVGYNLADLWSYETRVAHWPDYLAQYPAEWHPHLEAIRQSIIQHRVWAGGDWHQYSAHGMPIVSDGHFMSCTWREWGDLLAAVWNSELGERFSYMDFYMDGRLPPRP